MSTVQALLNHMQFMYDSIDSGKAFDTVDHNFFVKNDFYGVRGVSQEWLKSFIS